MGTDGKWGRIMRGFITYYNKVQWAPKKNRPPQKMPVFSVVIYCSKSQQKIRAFFVVSDFFLLERDREIP
jgi:hypothetical protein